MECKYSERREQSEKACAFGDYRAASHILQIYEKASAGANEKQMVFIGLAWPHTIFHKDNEAGCNTANVPTKIVRFLMRNVACNEAGPMRYTWIVQSQTISDEDLSICGADRNKCRNGKIL